MTLSRRALSAATLFLLCAGPALAGASSVPFNQQPDPGLRTAGRAELQSRIQRACTITQARLQNASATSFGGPCGCYAGRVMRGLSASELDAYRSTGYFNDSAREKALAAIDACKLRRPV
jgi:hypothetical protein